MSNATETPVKMEIWNVCFTKSGDEERVRQKLLEERDQAFSQGEHDDKRLEIVIRIKWLTSAMEEHFVESLRGLSKLVYLKIKIEYIPGVLPDYPILVQAIQEGVFKEIAYINSNSVEEIDRKTAYALSHAMEAKGLRYLFIYRMDIRQQSEIIFDGLKNSKTMEHFTLVGAPFVFDLFCNAISGHNYLKKVFFQLGEVPAYEQIDEYNKAIHQPNMNRFGRAHLECRKMGDPSIPLSLWPRILSRMQNHPSIFYSFFRKFFVPELVSHLRSLPRSSWPRLSYKKRLSRLAFRRYPKLLVKMFWPPNSLSEGTCGDESQSFPAKKLPRRAPFKRLPKEIPLVRTRTAKKLQCRAAAQGLPNQVSLVRPPTSNKPICRAAAKRPPKQVSLHRPLTAKKPRCQAAAKRIIPKQVSLDGPHASKQATHRVATKRQHPRLPSVAHVPCTAASFEDSQGNDRYRRSYLSGPSKKRRRTLLSPISL